MGLLQKNISTIVLMIYEPNKNIPNTEGSYMIGMIASRYIDSSCRYDIFPSGCHTTNGATLSCFYFNSPPLRKKLSQKTLHK